MVYRVTGFEVWGLDFSSGFFFLELGVVQWLFQGHFAARLRVLDGLRSGDA